MEENRKEGHLYLVTEDRNGIVYLWDYTEKLDVEFEETELPEDIKEVATEGVMLQFKDGKYVLYSKYGYDILEQEENDESEEINEENFENDFEEE